MARSVIPNQAQESHIGGPPLAGRYVLHERLGAGAFGVVYRAHDSQRNEEVAVKLLRLPTPEDIRLLKKEFRAVRNLAHPHLVTLRDLHQDADQCFFTMDAVPGKALNELLSERSSDTQVKSLIPVFADVANGLGALHSRGLVHRDLKPTNIIVTPQRRGVILDFGLASRVANQVSARSRSGVFAGSPGYASPEQSAGFDDVGPATDLFSLGVILYEAVEGRLPFAPQHIVSAAFTRAEPAFVREKVWPDLLSELVDELLSFDPDKRGQSLDVERRLRAMAVGDPATRMEGSGATEVFVGRADELAAVDELLGRRNHGRATPLVLVSGPAGIGKSAFISEVAQRRESDGEIVLRGTCHIRERIAFNAFDGVVDDIVRIARSDRPDVLVPRECAALCEMFPAFREIFAPVMGRPELGAEGQDAGFDAFVELLERLGNRAPVLVTIDDLQWADADSRRLLQRLGEARPRNWLLLGSRRPAGADSVGVAQFGDPNALPRAEFESSSSAVTIELGRLGPGDNEALSRQLVAELRLPDSDVVELARSSEGMPLWLRFAALARSRARDRTAPPPVTIGEMLGVAVDDLSDEIRDLLHLVLASSRPIPAAILRQAWHRENFERASGELVVRGLARREPHRDDWSLGVSQPRARPPRSFGRWRGWAARARAPRERVRRSG